MSGDEFGYSGLIKPHNILTHILSRGEVCTESVVHIGVETNCPEVSFSGPAEDICW